MSQAQRVVHRLAEAQHCLALWSLSLCIACRWHLHAVLTTTASLALLALSQDRAGLSHPRADVAHTRGEDALAIRAFDDLVVVAACS